MIKPRGQDEEPVTWLDCSLLAGRWLDGDKIATENHPTLARISRMDRSPYIVCVLCVFAWPFPMSFSIKIAMMSLRSSTKPPMYLVAIPHIDRHGSVDR
jgi:hypothetical protein